jgi:D-serine deaminase-like pyridoxal phosphate-dependent protein
MSRQSIAYDRGLIGQPGSREQIDTPALVLDLDAFDANVETMAALGKQRGISLRPHAKTHKCVSIARRQIEAGAIGQCCAKLGEAEMFADAGIFGLLITSTVQSDPKIARLAALAGRSRDLAVVVEDEANVERLGTAMTAAGVSLNVLIDCDVGTHRFGVTSPAQAVEVARAIARHPSLQFRGIQGYAGHCQSTPDYATRREQSHAALQVLGNIRDALKEAGFACPIVTGSGTGTHDFDHEVGVLTELQVGSYIFSDVIYDKVAMTPDGSRRWRNALFVHTRVLSSQHPGFATTDAGSKSFTMDGPAPVIASGAPQGALYDRFGDEFGKLVLPDGAGRLEVGTLLACIVPHCDPNVNFYDYYHCVRGDRLVDLWPVEARGCAG